jgi:hypothetical protein
LDVETMGEWWIRDREISLRSGPIIVPSKMCLPNHTLPMFNWRYLFLGLPDHNLPPNLSRLLLVS